MGTNYYWHPEPACHCCGRGFKEIHIGKSSAGWCFALHVIPEEGIDRLVDWVEKWSIPGSFILNEYGGSIRPEKMFSIIVERSWTPLRKFDDVWYYKNLAEPGPNGLIKARIDGVHCIGHGGGTWDYIIGEFS